MGYNINIIAVQNPVLSLKSVKVSANLKSKNLRVVTTSVDGNDGMFPVAYGVLESENMKSWTWFLKSLEKAIGTPKGLVISSDMQKGLEAAITQVYPNVEH